MYMFLIYHKHSNCSSDYNTFSALPWYVIGVKLDHLVSFWGFDLEHSNLGIAMLNIGF